MNVIKAKNINYEKISISIPKTINSNSYSYNITYDNDPSFVLQLPRCQLYSGLYESDGKFYCEILIPCNGVTSNAYFTIASCIEAKLKATGRFDYATFVGHLRKSGQDCSCLRLKMPQNKSQVTTNICSRSGERVALASLVKGVSLVPVVSIDYVYIINNTLGFNLLLKEAMIIDQ